MSTSKGPNLGLKLLAAGIVLGVGALIQLAQGEPMAPLLVPAVILAGLGIKILWRERSEPLPDARLGGPGNNGG